MGWGTLYWDAKKRRWRARAGDAKRTHLGYFAEKEDAEAVIIEAFRVDHAAPGAGQVRETISGLDINYTGLEPFTIGSFITPANVVLNFSAGTEVISAGQFVPGVTFVVSTLGEITFFANPTNSLTINTYLGPQVYYDVCSVLSASNALAWWESLPDTFEEIQ